ncbi:energy transducer TonB [Nitrococcus mobilis]|uniref:TonB protein n=1 Tax=Nitrococcus mobilis Nb-231 TaxID=314278 RepID=A4BSB5_9GAMM|nr:energy transducer TonB [Nitrococcus mobilis]EAR21375.1 TonB protein [Nitrococcus mobilis Nb-231]
MTNGASQVGLHARLPLIFLLSLALHLMVLLGLGFTWQVERTRRITPPIEITLAQRPQESPPRDFDFLAQANQNGGGRTILKTKPHERQPTSAAAHAEATPGAVKPPHKQDEQTRPVESKKPAPPKAAPLSKPTPHLNMAGILDTSVHVAARRELSSIVESVSAQYPSEQHIDARTHSHAAAEYMRQWIEKVERIGNLNYPREARERDLSGRLILEVALRPDGSVFSINVLAPSPFNILNEAAKRIVKLAEPYAKIPKTVLQGRDLLVITRSWEFDDARHFYPH